MNNGIHLITLNNEEPIPLIACDHGAAHMGMRSAYRARVNSGKQTQS